MASWGQVVDLWPDLGEGQRQEVLQGLVQQVVVKQKDRVQLRLLPFSTSHGQFIAIKSLMGAGVGLEPTTFGL